ncbi:MAG: zf-HC2 domain-containing protein [Desulfobacterales bacterium]|nr:zf-HC2 domain-containing protein [Desulfobacterales bacterium]
MTDPMGSCKEVSEILSAAMDRELTDEEKTRMKLHFSVCTWCQDHKNQLDTLRAAGKRLDTLCEDADSGVGLSPETRERIKHALKDHCPSPD